MWALARRAVGPIVLASTLERRLELSRLRRRRRRYFVRDARLRPRFRGAVEHLTGENTAPAPVQLDRRSEAAGPRRGRAAARIKRSVDRINRELVPISGIARRDNILREVRKIDVDAIADVLERVDAIGWHPSVYFNEPEYPGAEILPIRFTAGSSAPSSAS